MDNYDELQSKISTIESELAKAKLELESSKKDDFKAEVEKFFEAALDEQAITGMGLSFNLSEDMNFAKGMIIALLGSESSDDYAMAKTYFNSFKSKYLELSEKIAEVNHIRASVENMVRVFKNEVHLAEEKKRKAAIESDYSLKPEIAEI